MRPFVHAGPANWPLELELKAVAFLYIRVHCAECQTETDAKMPVELDAQKRLVANAVTVPLGWKVKTHPGSGHALVCADCKRRK